MHLDAAAVWAMSRRSWPLEGPSSGGARTIVYAGDDRVFVVSSGDAATGYGEVEERSVASFCEAHAHHPAARAAIRWLRMTAWLDARDGAALRSAWQALGATRIELGVGGGFITGHGVARLASELLGWPIERVAWLAQRPHEMQLAPSISYRVVRPTSACYLENIVDLREPCSENWALRELREGERGVQLVEVGFGIDDGSRDGIGGGGTVARIFDRAAPFGVSVVMSSRIVALAAPPEARDDIAARARHALDLYGENRPFRVPAWSSYDPARLRALAASLAAAVDPAFAGSDTWPGALVGEESGHDGRRRVVLGSTWRMTPPDGSRAVVVREHVTQDATPAVWVSVSHEGLAWGHDLSLTIDFTPAGGSGTLMTRLPAALRDAVLQALSDGAS